MIYVALLQGINVGGNNRVEMKKLVLCFEQLGFKKVRTYINSGNIFFETSGKNDAELVAIIEAAIAKDFGLNIKVVVRDMATIADMCSHIPQNWHNNTEMKTDVLFLWDEVDSPKVISTIKTNPRVDHIMYCNGAIVWNIDRKDYNKSGMNGIISHTIYRKMTVRNSNTTRKLLEIMQGMVV